MKARVFAPAAAALVAALGPLVSVLGLACSDEEGNLASVTPPGSSTTPGAPGSSSAPPTATPTGSSSAPPSASSSTPPAPVPIEFKACPLYSEGDGPAAECATVKMPLDRSKKDGETIDFFVKRYRPTGGAAKRALWLLQGGPGGSGYAFEKLAFAFGEKYPDVEYYMPDHRGTGRSQRLSCAAEGDDTASGFFIDDTEWAACTEEVKNTWAERLGAFTISNAANDLGLAIERTRKEGQPVFVMGASYGTLWAQRYLQLFPAQADGVILDSIATPEVFLSNQDKDCNIAARDLLLRCGQDELCSKKLGAGEEPWARAEALRDKIKADHCPAVVAPEGYTRSAALRQTLGQMMMDVRFRSLIPAVIYRLDRCTEEDASAVNQLLSLFFAPPDPSANEFYKQWGWIAGDHIVFSELWESPAPSPESLDMIRENAVASREITASRAHRQASWPRYELDEFSGKWAQTSVPMLMLQGGLDPATLASFAEKAGQHFSGPNQHYVFFPEATHATISSTTTKKNRSCATMTMMHFIEDPKGPLDTSCMADIVPLSFAKNTYTGALFGRSDPWEN